MDNDGRPLPVRDDVNTAYLDGWREGKLLVPRCQACVRFHFPPRPHCPHCWSAEIEHLPVRGEGVVGSYTLVRRPNHPSFESDVPITYGEVHLPENITILARLIGPNEQLSRDRRVLLLEHHCAEYALPVFRIPAHASGMEEQAQE